MQTSTPRTCHMGTLLILKFKGHSHTGHEMAVVQHIKLV